MFRAVDRAGPPSCPRRTGRIGIILALTLAFALPPPVEGSTGGIRMRRARFALARGAHERAVADLEAVRDAAPASAAGLEAALLLADIHFSEGSAGLAATILERAQEHATSSTTPTILLARGWLAMGTARPAEATKHFREAAQAPSGAARLMGTIGELWAAGSRTPRKSEEALLREALRSSGPPALRFLAGWTLVLAHRDSGSVKDALKASRRLRAAMRRTTFSDDAELIFALSLLDAGRARPAQRRLERLAKRYGDDMTRGAPRVGLQLADLRSPKSEIAARMGELYAGREDRSASLRSFIGGLLDRAAARDVEAALAWIRTPVQGIGAVR